VAGLTRRTGVAAAVLAAAIGLASCGGGTNQDALATCRGVHRALVDWARAERDRSPAARAAEIQAAHHQIALVQSDAALADSADGTYDALMTEVQEAAVMPFQNVAPTLRATCAAVTSPSSYL